jgi:hypothetical protein
MIDCQLLQETAMCRIAAWVATMACVLPAAAADPQFDPEARAKIVAPYLDEQTVGVYHLDVTRLDVDAIASKLGSIEKMPREVLAQSQKILENWVASFKRAGGKDLYLVASLADLPPGPPFLIVPLTADADASELMDLLGPAKGQGGGQEPKRLALPFPVRDRLGDVMFAGSMAARKRLKTLKPSPRPELAKAFAAAGDTTAQMIVLPTAAIRRIIEEQIPTLPRELGGEPSTVLTHGILWAAIGGDPPPKMSLHAVVQSQDAQAAKALDKLIATGLKAIAGHEQLRQALPGFDALLENLKPDIADNRLTLNLDDKTLTDLLVPGILRVRQASDRIQAMNNLKQIGLALHNYHDVNKAFPAAYSTDKDGKPLLSWRVHILPYLEQEQLYKQFHLDEPWNSPHNKTLIAKMPDIYQSTQQGRLGAVRTGLDAGKTTYLGVAAERAMFPGAKPVAFRDVTDGTSKTVFVVDANDRHAVIWTKPADYEYDAGKPMAALLGHYPDGFLALFVDGSVHVLPKSMSAKMLSALFTRNGGEAVDVP